MELDREACYRAALARDRRFDGRFFTGVKTTGIYCRPVCPARTPKFENCTFHPTAAAAEAAGFRACLRCRPESAPDLGAWRGTSNTVARALRLIEAGALDEGDVEALASRLGVGGRQLRRLFKQHLGATLVDVAQTRRVLLAKQLVQETSLPMTEVALASGFGSLRRFNDTFQKLYGRPPGDLRRSRAGVVPGAPVVLMLRAAEPFNWPELLAVLASRGDEVSSGCWRKAVETPDGFGMVEVTYAGAGRLRVSLNLPSLGVLPSVVARVRRVFDLGAEPLAVADVLMRDPRLKPLVEARPGLRVPGDWDEVEPVDPVVGDPAWRPWGAYAALHLEFLEKEPSHALAA